MLLPYEKGIKPSSKVYEVTPSDRAVRVLYYLQRVGYFQCDAQYGVKRKGLESFLLYYVIKGKLHISSRGEEVVIREGECGLLNCYEPHEYRAEGSLEYIWIHFDGANTRDFWHEVWQEHGLVLQANSNSRIYEQMLVIYEQLQKVGRIDEVTASKRMYDLLCSLLYVNCVPEANDPLIAEVQRYLNQHLAEELSTAALAKEFHLSVSQLNRRFREFTGQSPHEYLVNLRVNRAKELLKESKLSITEIAGEVGYAYDTSFAAVFRSKVGMSPRQFRNMPI